MKRFLPASLAILFSATTSFTMAQDTLIHLNPNPDTEIYTTAPASGEVYYIKKGIDIPLALAGTAYTLYGFNKIYGRDKVPQSEILALNVNDVNSFDRPVTKNYSTIAKDASDKFFYGSMPLPLILLLDKEIRHDGLKVGLLYLEALAITGTLYTTAAMTANRFRPYAYNKSLDMDSRTRGGARNSFYAGHVALVGTSTFFIAKVYTDYHPEMKGKAILFGLAGAATATTAVLRVEAGQHFKTDVILGGIMGPLCGILVPKFHKVKSTEPKLSFSPYLNNGAKGFTATYRLP